MAKKNTPAKWERDHGWADELPDMFFSPLQDGREAFIEIPKPGSQAFCNWRLIDYQAFAFQVILQLSRADAKSPVMPFKFEMVVFGESDEMSVNAPRDSVLLSIALELLGCVNELSRSGHDLVSPDANDARCASLVGAMHRDIESLDPSVAKRLRENASRLAKLNRNRRWVPESKSKVIQSLKVSWEQNSPSISDAKTAAARALGIGKRTLDKYLDEEEIDNDDWAC